jgi:hypothetical protein
MGLPIQHPAQSSRKSNVVRLDPGTPLSRATLQGWKEIAEELDRSVRTVQRWEQKLNLPIHKLGGGTGCPVFAFKDELRSWLRVKADEGMKTKTDASSKAASVDSLNQDGAFFERRGSAPVKAREIVKSQTVPSEPDIIKSLNTFFALKGANSSTPECNHCQAATRLLVGHFWLYGTEKTWQVSVPFCPNCDSDLRAMLPPSPERLT